MYKNWTKNLHNEGKVDSSLFDVIWSICIMLTALVTQIQSLYT